MAVVRELRPRGPYSLAQTLGFAGDATRRVRDGVLDAVVPGGDGPEPASAGQRPDGTVVVRARTGEGIERMRFVLALDDDHTDFLRRFANDPLLGRATHALRGLRQLRVPTVTQALLRALCGQLIESRRARSLERHIVRTTTPMVADGLHAPPEAASFGGLSPVALRSLGLHARRSASLVRMCRTFDPERLRALSSDAARERLRHERGLGPWSAGVVCCEGLGRSECGLVGDLGLIKLASSLYGRRCEPPDTEELLAPYGDWAGLASLYLLKAWGRGLIAMPDHARNRRAPGRFRAAAA